MKRTERVGAMIEILTQSPNKVYSLQYFCDLFGAAKSSISEDIRACNAALEFTGGGRLETGTGAKGGVRFVPHISDEKLAQLQAEGRDPFKLTECWAEASFTHPTYFSTLSSSKR